MKPSDVRSFLETPRKKEGPNLRMRELPRWYTGMTAAPVSMEVFMRPLRARSSTSSLSSDCMNLQAPQRVQA